MNTRDAEKIMREPLIYGRDELIEAGRELAAALDAYRTEAASVRAELADRTAERDSLAEQVQDTRGVEQHAEQEAYDHWCAEQDMGR